MSAKVTIAIDDSKLRAGIAGAGAHMQSFAAKTAALSKGMKSSIAGAFAFAGGIAALRGFVTEVARAKDLADRFGESAESIQRVGNAAELAGSDVEMIAKAMSRLTVEAAKNGDAFDALGISASDFIDAPLEKKLLMLAQAYEAATTDQTKMVQLMALLGSRAQDVLPLLAQGAARLRDEMAGVPVVTESAAQALAKLDDQIASIKQITFSWIGSAIQQFQLLTAAVSAWLASFDEGISLADAEAIFNAEAEEIRNPVKKAASAASKFDAESFDADSGDGKKKQAQAAAEASARALAIKDMMDEMRILEARAAGENKKADAMQKAAEIAKAARDIAKETGINEADALRIAQQRAALNEQIEKKAAEDEEGGRKKIHGFSSKQYAEAKARAFTGLDGLYALNARTENVAGFAFDAFEKSRGNKIGKSVTAAVVSHRLGGEDFSETYSLAFGRPSKSDKAAASGVAMEKLLEAALNELKKLTSE